jgi:hypothetical protein
LYAPFYANSEIEYAWTFSKPRLLWGTSLQSVISEFRIRGPDVTSEDQFPDLKVQHSTVVMKNDENKP